VDAPFAVDRLTALTHELGNLLDASMRCLGLARRALLREKAPDETADALRHLETVSGAMERMADLVHAAMRGSGSVVGSPNLTPTRAITLEEAISHAADVLRPEAEVQGIHIAVTVNAEVAPVPAGPLYSVILNGIRNAVEAIARSEPDERGRRLGRIDIGASIRPPRPGDDRAIDMVIIEIRDDGRGLPGGDPNRAFDFGFSTKPGSLGIGLALAREVVRELGGSIELSRRPDRASATRPGMILRIFYPVLRKEGPARG
jgi:signal transduction histidine kinase